MRQRRINSNATVAETEAYISAAEDAGITESERLAIVNMIAKTPDAGGLVVLATHEGVTR